MQFISCTATYPLAVMIPEYCIFSQHHLDAVTVGCEMTLHYDHRRRSWQEATLVHVQKLILCISFDDAHHC